MSRCHPLFVQQEADRSRRYSIRVGRSTAANGPFVDINGTDLRNGGGYIVYGSHDYVYGPGGQGVLSGYNGRDVLYYHYISKSLVLRG